MSRGADTAPESSRLRDVNVGKQSKPCEIQTGRKIPKSNGKKQSGNDPNSELSSERRAIQ